MEAVLEAVKRDATGKNENNRTRAAGHIPAVVYGAQKAGDAVAAVSVMVDPKPFMRILHSSSGLNTLITLKVPGETDSRVLVKGCSSIRLRTTRCTPTSTASTWTAASASPCRWC
jgi:ribosomal protein L25 (general stress protein Ctc)